MTTHDERLAGIEARIAAACGRAGRPRNAVRLVAVSKFHPPEAIEAVYRAGVTDFGENYPQELKRKAEQLAGLGPPALRWHAIGRLQRNKVPLVARFAQVFHALDDLELGRALGARRDPDDPLVCFVQLSFGEAQKGGVTAEALPSWLEQAREIPGLSIAGLMALPPVEVSAEATRPYFARLRALAREHGLSELSMGMTQDFEVAIEEGATVIRVGTAIFGERPVSGP